MGKRTSQLGEITTIDNNDILYGVDVSDLTHSPEGTSVKFKKSNLLKEVVSVIGDNASNISDLQNDVLDIGNQITNIYSAIEQGYSGWNPINVGCSYQGADAPSYSMYIGGNANLFLTLGMRILLTNGGSPKMFILTAISAYDAGNDRTLLTMYGGTDYTLANSAITGVYFSSAKVPYGFPLDPSKWSVEKLDTSRRQQANPTLLAWYNLGTTNSQLSIPIGNWNLYWYVQVGASGGASDCELAVGATLSTANNSEISKRYTSTTYMRYVEVGGAGVAINSSLSKEFPLIRTTKATYYLNGYVYSSTAQTDLSFFGNDNTTVIRATSAYL